MEKIFKRWILLKKNKNKQSATQQSKESAFVSEFDNLSDTAHVNALNMMKISEDKDFLMAQREEGRRGTMSGVDKVLFVKEKRADDKQKRMIERRRCMDNARAAASARVELESSADSGLAVV